MRADVAIIGGGPGGYPAAIRLAREGLRTVLIEQNLLGGECTNYGCVPSKALLRAARLVEDLSRHGWISASISPEGAFEWARTAAVAVRKGLYMLMKNAGVEVVRARAVAVNRGRVYLDNGESIEYNRALLLATGSIPRALELLKIDGKLVHDNRSIFSLTRIPRSLIIVGAGYVGVEFAYSFASLGTKVDIVEIADRPLPSMDRSLGLAAARALKAAGATLHLRSRIVSANVSNNNVSLLIASSRSGETEIRANAVLVAVGRVPAPLPAGLDSVGVRIRDGWVSVDCHMRAADGIYAAGDITGPPLLAHKAILQSLVAADNILGRKSCLDPDTPIPEVVFIRPELVRVEKRNSSHARRHRIRVDGLARARIEGEGGFLEIYTDSSGHVSKIVMAFEGASELAGLAWSLVARGATLEEAASIVFPHPTMSEALGEALHSALGRPVHVF